MSVSGVRGASQPKLTTVPDSFSSLQELAEWQQNYRTSVYRELQKAFRSVIGNSADISALDAALTALTATVAGITTMTLTVAKYTASNTFTNSTGQTLLVRLSGTAPGGAGGSVANTAGNAGGGGGAGENFDDFPWILANGATLTWTINAAGAAAAAGDNDGGNGGDLVVTDGTTTVTFVGGKGGARGSVKTAGLGGGWASTAVNQNATAEGPHVWCGAAGNSGSATTNPSGGQETFRFTTSLSGQGGSSKYGLGGQGLGAQGAGNAPSATSYGAGGGGAFRGGVGSAAAAGASGAGGFFSIAYWS